MPTPLFLPNLFWCLVFFFMSPKPGYFCRPAVHQAQIFYFWISHGKGDMKPVTDWDFQKALKGFRTLNRPYEKSDIAGS